MGLFFQTEITNQFRATFNILKFNLSRLWILIQDGYNEFLSMRNYRLKYILLNDITMYPYDLTECVNRSFNLKRLATMLFLTSNTKNIYTVQLFTPTTNNEIYRKTYIQTQRNYIENNGIYIWHHKRHIKP